jgi:hypothetical protein
MEPQVRAINQSDFYVYLTHSVTPHHLRLVRFPLPRKPAILCPTQQECPRHEQANEPRRMATVTE